MTDESTLIAEARHIQAVERIGYRLIADRLGVPRRRARKWLGIPDRKGPCTALAIIPPSSSLPAVSWYDQARTALAHAKTMDEVNDLADKGAAIREYARRARDRTLMADAEAVVIRAERRLGEMVIGIKQTTGLNRGGRQKADQSTGPDLEPVKQAPTLADLGIDKKLSARAQKLASISERAIEARLAARHDEGGSRRMMADIIKQTNKAERRAARERALAVKIAAGNIALPSKRYGVILADPEWRFEPWSRETGMDRAADNHYPTSVTEVIAARPVQSIAAEDCVLFLWATAPMLPHALTVMAAWGFEYKSQLIWQKESMGTGYWFRNWHELLLLGTCGSVPAPAPGAQWGSIQEWPRGAHSEKPSFQYEMIESYFPHLPKIELNARRPREGWDRWGLEAEKAAAEE